MSRHSLIYPLQLARSPGSVTLRGATRNYLALLRLARGPYIGSHGKVSEMLAGKRPLSLRMIRALHKGLGIPAKVLLRDVPLEKLSDADRKRTSERRKGLDPQEVIVRAYWSGQFDPVMLDGISLYRAGGAIARGVHRPQWAIGRRPLGS